MAIGLIELPYGSRSYLVDLGARPVTLVAADPRPPPPPITDLLAAALAAPIDAPPLAMDRPRRATVVVSDGTRREPRRAFVDAIRRALPSTQLTLAVATGTHGPADLAALDLPADLPVVNHDGHRDDDLVDLGTTPHGTRARVHRCLVDTDLVVATGCIRPHYFAGFGAGTKAIFPGLGAAAAIRHNHALKTDPRAIAGNIDDNPCRRDLEDVFRLLPTPCFLVDGVLAPDHQVHAVVAGAPLAAFRAGVALARPWFTVRAPRAALVIASDELPITASLYQAAKIAAAVAPLVLPGGDLAVVAACADGIEPLAVVNEAIFRIGVLPRLAAGATLSLVSELPADQVRRTLLRPASLAELVAASTGPIVVVPRASSLLIEVSS